MKVNKKKLLFIFLLILSLRKISFSQTDTLNKLDTKGKKEGYWICYIDSTLKLVKDKSKAKYYGYDYYEKGRNLTNICQRHFKIKFIENYPDNAENNKLSLITGTIVVYSKDSINKGIEIYNLGHPIKYELYVKFKSDKGRVYRSEYIDFSKRYNNILGSSYCEEKYRFDGEVNKYYFAKLNGKWKAIKVSGNHSD